MTVEEVRQQVRDRVEWLVEEPKDTGQQLGLKTGITLRCEEFDIEIKVGSYRSREQNKELALILFELVLKELIK